MPLGNNQIQELLALSSQVTALSRRVSEIVSSLQDEGSDEWVTTREAEKLTGLSNTSINRKIKDGEYVVKRISERKVFIKKSCLFKEAEAQSNKPGYRW